MQTFLAKCLACGLIVGGFVFTGDAARLARRARRFVDETPVPAEAATPPRQAASTAPVSPPAAAAKPRESRWQPTLDAPPPTSSLDAVSLGSLRPGDRLLVWIARPSPAGRGASAPAVFAFDIVDPATGEALEQRHVTAADGSGVLVHAAPRRVVIAGSGGTGRPGAGVPAVEQAGSVMKGRAIVLAPRTPSRGNGNLGPGEAVGPVHAIAVACSTANAAPEARP
ncbi:MAG: hypothetical protein EBZ59_05535 [Planctomycetia bacterium]|nr:hypothetical protein [Planctomycetia bacterium]